jgi:proteasome assembly chaperone (PAC2) family protein
MKTFIHYEKEPDFENPVAILGAQGLRSAGIVAIDHLIKAWGGEKYATMYSPHFPVIYEGLPYTGVPGVPGAGVSEDRLIKMPGIEYFHAGDIILIKGYHPDNFGQYKVVEKVVENLQEAGVKKVITMGGFVREDLEVDDDRKVSFCATNRDIHKNMRDRGMEVSYVGPFYGFSGLILGACQRRRMDGLGLFGQTVPHGEDPTFPDPEAAGVMLKVLGSILGKEVDTQGIEEVLKGPRVEKLDEGGEGFVDTSALKDTRWDDVGYI